MIKRCRNCFEQFEEEYRVCPYCGYVDGTIAEESMYLPLGTVLNGRYLIGRVLGCGEFGTTYLAWDMQQNEKCAVKEYMPGEFSTRDAGALQVTVFHGESKEQFLAGQDRMLVEAKELIMLGELDGIVKIQDSFAENGTAYVVMEYLEGETLKGYLEREKRIEPELAVAMLQQMMESLKKIHGKGILHRDIAPDNIFLTVDGKIKLIDFGAARYATAIHSRSMTMIIKQGYSPEEQYRSRGDWGTYTDVYALGATLYRMITGVVPPDAMERRMEYEKSGKDLLVLPEKLCRGINENIQNALLNALNVRIEDRTADVGIFLEELTSGEPVKRHTDKIKKIDWMNWPKPLKIVISALSLILILLHILFFFGLIGFRSELRKDMLIPEGMSRVPSVVNDSLDECERRLEVAVLLYRIEGKEYSDEVPSSLILHQNITGGAVVTENTILSLIVSGGPELGEVKDVEGMEEHEAEEMLNQAGFCIEIRREYNAVIAKGYVIRQSAEPKSVLPKKSKIILTISDGMDPDLKIEKKQTEIPDFVGKTYQEAQQSAEKAGLFLVVKKRVYSHKYENNVIVSQNGKAGEMAMTGDTIELTISMGREMIRLEDVQYLTEQMAVEKIKEQGLECSISYEKSETVAAGLVIRQWPESGTEMEPEEWVELVVSRGDKSDEPKQPSRETQPVNDVATSEEIHPVQGEAIAGESHAVQDIPLPVQTQPTPEIQVSTENQIPKETQLDRDTVSPETVTPETITPETICQTEKETEPVRVVLNHVGVETAPTKTVYCIGETLDTDGMVLAVSYSNGVTEYVSSGYSCSPTILDTAGIQSIKVQYGGLETSFQITVENLIAFGSCGRQGNNIEWRIDSHGVLIFSGQGEMADYGEYYLNPQPWYAYRSSIWKVVVEPGITSIGNYAFNKCSVVGSFEIPNTVLYIGERAFCDCGSLTEYAIPDSVTDIGKGAFNGCTALKHLIIPNSVKRIGEDAFTHCLALEELHIPDSVTSIGSYAFNYCNALVSITIPKSVVAMGECVFSFCYDLQAIYIQSYRSIPSGWNTGWHNWCDANVYWGQ